MNKEFKDLRFTDLRLKCREFVYRVLCFQATRRSLVSNFVINYAVATTYCGCGWCCVRDRGTLCQPQRHHPQLVRIAICAPKGSTDCKSALAGGGFVDAVPKARPVGARPNN